MNPPPPEPSKPTSAQTPSSNALNFSKRQLVFAFGIAGISDVFGAFTTPLPPIAWGVDFVTALLLFLVLGPAAIARISSGGHSGLGRTSILADGGWSDCCSGHSSTSF
jgi:hypothetical protein